MSTITISEVGTVGSDPDPSHEIDGIDHAGIFGPPGESLIGKTFVAIFTGSDCACSGVGTANPVLDATLTINGQTFDFGSGSAGDMFPNLAQVDIFDNLPRFVSDLSIAPGFGLFRINNQAGFLETIQPSASGSLHGVFSSPFAPGPIAGDFASSALFLLALLPWLIKRKLSSYRPRSSVR
jgi:hypothetical protein